ncbi:polymorphic toxin-type HINT domain-containing protein [Streptomyces sp. NPDC091209]|uniref:polymorphic toxin-type HINT domain-containing protein n=1 Tax=Streptomyces sp. NPDC091209 TaxID=3365974 RepID=UPI003801E1E8
MLGVRQRDDLVQRSRGRVDPGRHRQVQDQGRRRHQGRAGLRFHHRRPLQRRPQRRVLEGDDHRRYPVLLRVQPGDEVEAADPRTGRHKGPRKVVARLVHRDNDLLDLTVRDRGDRIVTLHTTAGHPFWDETTHAWTGAAELVPGHDLITADDKRVTVVDALQRPGAADMYNLTVEELHTYYVLAGSAPVFVHNSGVCPKAVEAFWHPGSFETSAASFEFHFVERHGARAGVTREQYLQDAKEWAEPPGAARRKGWLERKEGAHG